jgi:hypothetical protein
MAELVDELIADDLVRMQGKLGQNLISVGMLGDGTPLTIPPYRRPVGKHLHLLSI